MRVKRCNVAVHSTEVYSNLSTHLFPAGEGTGKCGDATLGSCLDVTAERFNNGFGDGEAKPGTFAVPLARRVDTIKSLKEPGKMTGGDSVPWIDHSNADMAIPACQTNSNSFS